MGLQLCMSALIIDNESILQLIICTGYVFIGGTDCEGTRLELKCGSDTAWRCELRLIVVTIHLVAFDNTFKCQPSPFLFPIYVPGERFFTNALLS